MQPIENIGYGKTGKIFLEWSEPWWAFGEGGIQLAWPESSALSNSMSPTTRTSSNQHLSKSNNHKFGGYNDEWGDEIQCLETNGLEDDVHNAVQGMVDDRLRHWYRGISNFSEVDNQPNLLLCWIAGESAKIADQLDDEEVGIELNLNSTYIRLINLKCIQSVMLIFLAFRSFKR